MTTKLIYDLGAHHGGDTAFYLAKGARVVAVEANPKLAAVLRERFAAQIADGSCVVVEAAVMAKRGTVSFYANPRVDHWSSLSRGWAAQDGGEVEQFEVEALPLADLFARHGAPYYLKVDIEGADKSVVAQLHEMEARPRFLSVEEWGFGTLEMLAALGYDRFSLRPQYDKSWCVESGAEGPVTGYPFDYHVSGLFGLEVREWVTLGEAMRAFVARVRKLSGEMNAPPGEFFDVHAARAEDVDLHGQPAWVRAPYHAARRMAHTLTSAARSARTRAAPGA